MAPLPYTAFVRTLNKMPEHQVIVGGIVASFVAAGMCSLFMSGRGEHIHTLAPEWVAANKKYMQFQKMNPISGVSRGL